MHEQARATKRPFFCKSCELWAGSVLLYCMKMFELNENIGNINNISMRGTVLTQAGGWPLITVLSTNTLYNRLSYFVVPRALNKIQPLKLFSPGQHYVHFNTSTRIPVIWAGRGEIFQSLQKNIWLGRGGCQYDCIDSQRYILHFLYFTTQAQHSRKCFF